VITISLFNFLQLRFNCNIFVKCN